MKLGFVYRGKPDWLPLIPKDVDHVLVECPPDANYPPEALAKLADVDGIYVSNSWINAQVFSAARKLKMVQTSGAGYDKLDIPAATKHGVLCCNNGDFNSNRVADFSMMLILTQMRNYVPTAMKMYEGDWAGARALGVQAVEVEDKTLGIIGFGNIGSRLSRRARAHEMKVIYNDIVPDRNKDVAEAVGARLVEKDELFATSDVISINTPLNDTTRNLVDERAISLMKPGVFIVCTARGNIINEAALRKALDEGKVAGAGIDVFSFEPFADDNPLRGAKNIVMSPHVAGRGKEGVVRSFNGSMDNLKRFLVHDQQPNNVLNPR